MAMQGTNSTNRTSKVRGNMSYPDMSDIPPLPIFSLPPLRCRTYTDDNEPNLKEASPRVARDQAFAPCSSQRAANTAMLSTAIPVSNRPGGKPYSALSDPPW